MKITRPYPGNFRVTHAGASVTITKVHGWSFAHAPWHVHPECGVYFPRKEFRTSTAAKSWAKAYLEEHTK